MMEGFVSIADGHEISYWLLTACNQSQMSYYRMVAVVSDGLSDENLE